MKRAALSLVLFALFLFVAGCRAAEEPPLDQTAIKRKVSYITTLAAAVAAAKGIAADRQGHGQLKSLQEYHADIR